MMVHDTNEEPYLRKTCG